MSNRAHVPRAHVIQGMFHWQKYYPSPSPWSPPRFSNIEISLQIASFSDWSIKSSHFIFLFPPDNKNFDSGISDVAITRQFWQRSWGLFLCSITSLESTHWEGMILWVKMTLYSCARITVVAHLNIPVGIPSQPVASLVFSTQMT